MDRINDKRHVYALVDPVSGEPKYIGVSVSPEYRLEQHINTAIYEICRKNKRRKITPEYYNKCKWIVSLKEAGLLPQVIVLTQEKTSDFNEIEQYWYEKYTAAGFTLFNNPARAGINY